MKIILIFILFSAIMWYFNVDVRGFVNAHPDIKTSLDGAKSFLVSLWHNYLADAASYIWNDVMKDIIWKHLSPFISKGR